MVFLVVPRQARIDHRQIDILAIKHDLAQSAAVMIELLSFDLHAFAEDQISQMLLGPLPKRHFLFWRINAR